MDPRQASFLSIPKHMATSVSRESFATDASVSSCLGSADDFEESTNPKRRWSKFFSDDKNSDLIDEEHGLKNSISQKDMESIREQMFEKMLEARLCYCMKSSRTKENAWPGEFSRKIMGPFKSHSASDLTNWQTSNEKEKDAICRNFSKFCSLDASPGLSAISHRKLKADFSERSSTEDFNERDDVIVPNFIGSAYSRLTDTGILVPNFQQTDQIPVRKSSVGTFLKKLNFSKNLGSKIREDLSKRIEAYCRKSEPEAWLNETDLNLDSGRPLNKFERNVVIFDWLRSMDDSCFEEI